MVGVGGRWQPTCWISHNSMKLKKKLLPSLQHGHYLQQTCV
jgi:hypothetical protein